MIDASVFYLAACSETDPAGGIYRCRGASLDERRTAEAISSEAHGALAADLTHE